jgi:hypothetical protein
MAENDGNTLPAAKPSAVRRPLEITPSELLPVVPAVFEAIHKVNAQFENLLRDLETLQGVPYFPHKQMTYWQQLLGRTQAEMNGHLAEAIGTRAEENALYFDRLCARYERERADPDDVLYEAEYRKQELAAQEQMKKDEPEESEGLVR